MGVERLDQKIALAHQVQASRSRGFQTLVDRQRTLARQGDMTGPGLDVSTRDDRAAIERLEQNIARPMGADASGT